MSRHSKNNTANSIFTYEERRRLKEYGTQKTRIGTDAQKQFNQCFLCLQQFVNPLCCSQGHVFCKNCIVQNLGQQQKLKEIAVNEWKERRDRAEKDQKYVKALETEKVVQTFQKNEFDLDFRNGYKDLNQRYEQNVLKSEEQLQEEEKLNMINMLKNPDMVFRFDRDDLKKKYSSANFWMATNLQAIEEKVEERKPVIHHLCPADNVNRIKFKRLVPLEIEKHNEQLCCWACKKELKFQKIVALRKCGHVMCKKCLEDLGKGGRCIACNRGFGRSDVIDLAESMSSFSSHNQVESGKYSYAFQT